jgi:hypothetical protein
LALEASLIFVGKKLDGKYVKLQGLKKPKFGKIPERDKEIHHAKQKEFKLFLISSPKFSFLLLMRLNHLHLHFKTMVQNETQIKVYFK